MADTMSYSSAPHHYMPPPQPQYYSPHSTSGHVHSVSPQPPRQETTTQRKRPKYTRSKTGCMTCRIKKIKCDESKPNCMRCAHGQRDCTWPEGVPARKKPIVKKEHTDGSISTGSPISDMSSPSTRDISPHRGAPADLGLPPLASRRHTEPYLHLHPMPPQSEPRQLSDRHYAHSNPNSPSILAPELTPYPQTRYDYSSQNAQPSGRAPSNGRPGSAQWNAPPPLLGSSGLDAYHYHVQDRSLMGHVSNEHHRYHQ